MKIKTSAKSTEEKKLYHPTWAAIKLKNILKICAQFYNRTASQKWKITQSCGSCLFGGKKANVPGNGFLAPAGRESVKLFGKSWTP